MRCKREWCPECGKNTVDDDEMGYLQKQRYARTIGKAQIMYHEFLPVNSPNKDKNSLGQFVVTFPEKIQGEIYRRQVCQGDAFTRVRNVVQDALNAEGYDAMLTAFHLQGDKNEDELWRPHLHVLVSDGYLKQEKLEQIKTRIQLEVAKLLREWCHQPVWNFRIVVNYNYVEDDEEQLKHKVRYLVRPTMTNQRENEEAVDFYEWTYGRKRLQLSGPLKNSTLIVPLGKIRGINLNTCTEISPECPSCGSEKLKWQWLKYLQGLGEILSADRSKNEVFVRN